MWGRIYPHAVLLIFANIILRASSKGSLTFLIDDTGSMGNDIEQVRSSVNRISNIVFSEKSSLISNMVLVTFNDPGAQVRTVTDNRNTFKQTLDAVYAHNFYNYDCWEPSMNGLLLALVNSNSNSYIYVFTDAPAKDYRDARYVKDLCQKKQSQIVFVLTGRCYNYYEPQAFDVYFDIAHACSGLAFDVSKTAVNEVLRTIDETVKDNKTVITSTTVKAGDKKDIPFIIDDQTDYAIVSVSGRNVYLGLYGPSANLERIMWNNNGKVAKLSNAKPGEYVATVMGQTRTSVVIVGRTDFFFSHGFSVLTPNSLGDTSLQPIADANVHLSISVTDVHQSVRIVQAQILDMNENLIISPMPLIWHSKDFYVTAPFVAPSQRFQIAVFGIVKATNKAIKRIVKIPITPAEPPKVLPTNTKPTVEIAEGKAIEVEFFDAVKVTCRVVAFPEPIITWIDNNGGTMLSEMSLQEYPYKYISYMVIPYKSKGDRYTCYAVNNVGSDATTINVVVKEPFTVRSAPSEITKFTYGTEGTITCDVALRPPGFTMYVHWHYANKMTGQSREIETSDKYEVSASRTQLKIKKMDLDLVGRYTCKFSLAIIMGVEKSFSTQVEIVGLIAPKIQGRTEIKFIKGETAILECKVASGVPAPKITWLFGGKTGSQFTPIAGSENVLRITNVDGKHEGKYKCVAENSAGKDEHVTTLFVQDLPNITTKSSVVYQATEGDALLRIPCVATGVPKPVIVWKLSGRYITPSAKYSVEDGTLTIRNPKVGDTNSYTCEAKNEAGVIRATFKTYIRQAPRVSGVTEKKVSLGMPVIIECTVEGEPKPTIKWQFMDHSSSKMLPIPGSDKVLNFPRVDKKHAGSYKCVAQNEIGSDEHVTTLIVEFAPEIIEKSTTVEGKEGDLALSIPCDVVGNPKPIITWKLKGSTITSGAKYSIKDGTLIIRNPKVSDTNSYTCEAKNEAGVVSATFKMYIRLAPKIQGRTEIKFTKGETAILECKVASGVPAPKITWLFGGKTGSQFTPIAGSENVLRITNVDGKHEGKYKCVAENSAGKDEHVTTLFVQDLPNITTKSSVVYQATEGDALLRIPCVATGVPKPVIVWKLSGRYITPSAKYSVEDGTLTIRNPKVGDTNSYTCEAKNEAGVIRATFKTYIRQAPRVSGVTEKKVSLGMPVIIECTVEGEPKPTIKWQFMDHSSSKMLPIPGSDKVLNFPRVDKKHAGSYKCVAQNEIGSDEHVTTLIVEFAPEIIEKSTTVEGKEGDLALSIPCDVVGNPKPIITWKLKGSTITSGAKYSIKDGTLIIRNPKVSDTNSYTCEAKNEAGVVSATFKMYIRLAPKIQGRTEIKFTKGETAILECKVASGVPAPKITWLFGGKTGSQFTPIAGSENVLRITNVDGKHEGKYKCVAENSAGKDEHVTTLFVQDLPNITTKSSVVYQATEGDALLRIPCVATGVPKPVIVWKLSGRYITPSAKYSVEDGTLTIRNPKVGDTNSYTCEAKNEAGVIRATFKTYIRQAPRVSGVTEKKVSLGMPVIIECTVEGEPKPTIKWQFMDHSSSKMLPIPGSDKVLNFPRVDKKHAGSYKCVAQNEIGSDEHVTTLIVEFAPEIIEKSTTVEGKEGDLALSIPCDVVGNPKPIITWKLKGSTITSGAKYSIKDGTLIIRNPKVSDTNSYTCEAKNEAGVVSATFKMYIRLAPKIQGRTEIKFTKGETAILECKVASGVPAPKITWLFGGKTGSQFTPIAGSENVLRITNVEGKHEGKYKCVAENSAGKDEHVTTLFVQDLPNITTKSSVVYQATEGDALLRIPCVATGVPKPVIVWKLSGRYITPSAKYSVEDGTLTIRNPKVGDTNSYTCEAKNEAGVIRATFKTYIRQAPRVSGVTEKKVSLGMPVIIECTVEGEPKPTIKWQFMDHSSSKMLPIPGSDRALNFPRVDKKHAGSYKCVAQNEIGSDGHVTTLIVEFAPEIIEKSTTVEGKEGDLAISIPCDVVGNPKPIITWKLKGSTITSVATVSNVSGAKYSIKDGTLIIRNPKVSDTNSYTCEANNEAGVVSATFKMYIRLAPKIQGRTEIKFTKGETAILECKVASGVPAPKITWLFGGKTGSQFTPLAGSENVLRITNVEGKQEGKYKCVAENSAGKDEHVTTLFVQDLPNITTKSSVVYQATEGDALLRIPCVATGVPKPVIVWKLSGRYITPSAKYSIEDGTLIIRNPKVGDTNSYTCEAKNEAGVISATFKTYIRLAPKIQGRTEIKFTKGETAILECKVASGVPAPKITWLFGGKTGSQFTPIAGSENVLRITNVEGKHEGKYKCVAENSAGKDEHVTTLFVQDLPNITTKSSVVYQATEGDALLRIPCVATGVPKPVIVWKLSGRYITPSAKYSIEDGTLIIRNPKVGDTNSYTCEAKNEAGVISATFKTYIRQAPRVSGVTEKKVRLGMSVIIECTVEGEPKPTIKWQFMDHSSSKMVPIPGSDNVQYFPMVDKKHAGSYKCVAQNEIGSDEHVTTLIVEFAPEIIEKSTTVEGKEGDLALSIPCDVVGNPKPIITWKLKGSTITSGAKYSIKDGTLIIRNPKLSDTDSYTCEAKNEAGVISATFKTYIRQAPRVSGVTAKKVRLGMPANIECTVEGDPKPTIKWQFMDKSSSKMLPIPGSNKVLHIPRVENKHAGSYKCVAQNELGSDEHITMFIVEFAPEIKTNSTTVEGIEGDLALRIPCDVVGNPKPVITWKLKGATITPDSKYLIEGGALVIMKPTENDSSMYTCEAKNFISTVSTTFQATVEKLPTNFGTEHFVYLLQGKTEKIKCDAYSSATQSVQWFITKARPRALDSSLSTTSSPELESSETTTASSKDYSSTPRPIITKNAHITEPYIQIANASYTDHDGNYTCRVSDKHGNTYTHTYVVDVGSAPEFQYDVNPLNNWRGVISHITQNCDIRDGAKPKPVVEWMLNGKVLTDLNLAGEGHYTCNISNVHKSVQRSFDVKSLACLISRNLRDADMPLVLDDRGFWHKFENTEHYTIVEQEEKITFSCPSQKEANTFKNFPKKSKLEAFCNKGDSFVVEDKIYKLSDLQCTQIIQPSVIRKKVKCLSETSELFRVGYNVPGFLEAYEVCFDTEKNMPLYTRIVMTETDNKGISAGYNWHTYPGIGNNKTERGFPCKDTMSSCCYSKSQLVNAIDFNDGPAMQSTFIDPLNVVPVWLPCNTSKPTWETVNDQVTTLLPMYNEVITWSGTHTFQEKNGVIIPRYLWKLVWYDDKEVVAIVHVNDPSPTEKDIKCKDTSNRTEYKQWIHFNDKYTYCCSQSIFSEAFNIHIDIGDFLETALDEIKNIISY